MTMRTAIVNNMLETLGTPLVRLNRLVEHTDAAVLLKMEAFNPGGSVKSRIAIGMIEAAEKQGVLTEDSVIIEPTSGNTGIGLAMVGAVKGYQVKIIMPDSYSIERRKILKAYGAEVILTSGREGMQGAIKKAKELLEENPNFFMPDQFNNPANPRTHRRTTAKEIIESAVSVDFFVAGVGSGGTLTGVGEVLKQHFPNVEIIAVEPEESPVLSGGKAGFHRIEGLSAGFIPLTLNTKIIARIIKVSSKDAIVTARRLAKEEGILAGISAGANVCASLQIAREAGKGKTVVTIAPDSGERYLSTELFEE